MNHKPMPYFDDLCIIFGVDQATGAHAVQPGDVVSRVVARPGVSSYMDEDEVEQGDSYNIPNTGDHNAVMEDLINQGDLALKRRSLYQELAKFPELTSNQRSRALRHLNRDDGDASTFFQFPTDEEKLEFVWEILE
ncbi:hypothetical protein LINPERPRIM_LOCUS21415 [Linum perenne]